MLSKTGACSAESRELRSVIRRDSRKGHSTQKNEGQSEVVIIKVR